MTRSREARGLSRLGFGKRIALLFGGLALLLVLLGVVVSMQVADMRTQVRRVLEEQREAAYTRDLVHALRMFDAHVALRGVDSIDAGEAATLREYLALATTSIDELRRGPGHDDPSSEEHTLEEYRYFDALEDQLETLALGLAGPQAKLRESTAESLRNAQKLHEEVRDEATDSSRDLQQRGRDLRGLVLWTSAIALAVLGVVLWMVRRFVVRPVEALRAGVASLASGRLEQRVEVHSRDEIGELALEFNRMADELSTMRRDLEQRVEQRTQEFLRAARLAGLGTMAAGIAHEINNPLASIASCAEGLERKLAKGNSTPAEQAEYLQLIAKEAYRAHEITSRLLEFARTESSPPIAFSLVDLLRELEVLLAHKLRARRLTLETHCAQGLPPLHGNPSECKQVLLNLIHNAIDASPDGGRIRVSCRRVDSEAVLEIEDQGPGIPSEHLSRIFDPFFTTKAPGKGTGLGLAIVHRIVAGHGGRIEVENTGRGALFRVHVPLSAA